MNDGVGVWFSADMFLLPSVELQDGSDPVVQQNKIYQNMFGEITCATLLL